MVRLSHSIFLFLLLFLAVGTHVVFGQTAIVNQATDSLVFLNNGNKSMVVSPQGQVRLGEVGSVLGSALFQMNSTSKGLLIPRMNSTQRDGISSPATGLLIYNTTDFEFQTYNGSDWESIMTDWSEFSWISDADYDTGIEVEETADSDTISFYTNGVQRMVITSSGKIGIGTDSPSEDFHMEEGKMYHYASGNGVAGTTIVEYTDAEMTGGTQSGLLLARGNSMSILNDGALSGSLGAGTLAGAVQNTITTSSTGTINEMFGAVNHAGASGAHGTISNAYGSMNLFAEDGSGTVNNAFGSTHLVMNEGSGTIGTAIGLYTAVNNTGAGAITNGYGLYIEDVTDATNHAAILSEAGNIMLNSDQHASSIFLFRGGADPALLYANSATDRIGIGVGSPAEKVDIDGGIKIGTTTETNAGTIRWTGSDFEGYDGAAWNSLTGGGGGGDGHSLDADDGSPTDALYVDATGNVGIGTTTPSHIFTIEGSNDDVAVYSYSSATSGAKADYMAYRARGSSGSPSAVLDDDGILGLRGYAYDGGSFLNAAQINFEIDGVPGSNDVPTRIVFSTTLDGGNTPEERMRIGNNGYVGIGTDDPATKLELESPADVALTLDAITNATNNPYIQFKTQGFYRFGMGVDNVDVDKFKISAGVGLANERLTISGNYIGLHTGDPLYPLHVVQDNASGSLILTTLAIERTTTGTPSAGIGTAIDFKIEDAGGIEEQATLDVVLEDATDGSEDAAMVFNLNYGGSMTEIMRVGGTFGNVGIGTPAPEELLTLSRLTNPVLRLDRSNTSAKDWEVEADNNGFHISGGADGTGASLTEFVTVDESGNVGIGTTSPSSNLEVQSANAEISVDHTNTGSTSIVNMTENDAVTGQFGQIGSTNGTYPNDMIINNATTGAGNGGINLSISNAILTPSLRINNIGNVGLGIYDADSELHVYRNGTSPAVKIQGTAAGNKYSGLILSSEEATDKHWLFMHMSSPANELHLAYSPDDGTTFHYPIKIAPQSGDNRLVIDGSGNVGVGTSTPDYVLDVLGDARVGFNGNTDTIQLIPIDFQTMNTAGGSGRDVLDIIGGKVGQSITTGNSSFMANVKIPVGFQVMQVVVYTNTGGSGPFNVTAYKINVEDGTLSSLSPVGATNSPVNLDAPLKYKHNIYLGVGVDSPDLSSGGDIITGGYVLIEPF